MSGKFQPINRDTAYLLPPSLQDWLPEKHLARFVVDIVDQLDDPKKENITLSDEISTQVAIRKF